MMGRIGMCGRGIFGAVAIYGFGVASLQGQGVSLGVQGSVAEDTDFGLGPRAIIDLGPFDAGLRLVGSFELFFPGSSDFDGGSATISADNVNYWEANVNVVYTLGLPVVPLTPYVGGGLNFAHLLVEGSPGGRFDTDGTDTGVNVLAGAELELFGFAPFFELRYELGGGDQWVATGGITFR